MCYEKEEIEKDPPKEMLVSVGREKNSLFLVYMDHYRNASHLMLN